MYRILSVILMLLGAMPLLAASEPTWPKHIDAQAYRLTYRLADDMKPSPKWNIKRGASEQRVVYGLRMDYEAGTLGLNAVSNVDQQESKYRISALMDIMLEGDLLQGPLPQPSLSMNTDKGAVSIYIDRREEVLLKELPAKYNYGYLPTVIVFQPKDYQADVVFYTRGIAIENVNALLKDALEALKQHDVLLKTQAEKQAAKALKKAAKQQNAAVATQE